MGEEANKKPKVVGKTLYWHRRTESSKKKEDRFKAATPRLKKHYFTTGRFEDAAAFTDVKKSLAQWVKVHFKH